MSGIRKISGYYRVSPTLFVGGSSLFRLSIATISFADSSLNAFPTMLLLSVARGIPLSPASAIPCTRGICPNSGMEYCSESLLHPFYNSLSHKERKGPRIQFAGHAKVHDQRPASGEAQDKGLPVPVDLQKLRPGKGVAKSAGRCAHQHFRLEHANGHYPASEDALGEVAAYSLDFREFGHRQERG